MGVHAPKEATRSLRRSGDGLNDATRRIEGVRQEKLGSAAGGMTMPPGFGALFGA